MAFNEIAVLILMRVIGWRCVAVAARRNHGFRAALGDVLAQVVCIEGFVGEHRIAIDILQQRGRLRDVMCLSLGQDQSGKIAQALDQRMDLGAQSAARAPDRLRPFSLAAPEECWCARTMVLSRNTSSNSAPLANSVNTRCQTPLLDQRAKHVYTLFQRPNSAGKSRHGLPVRAIHSTASMNSRLSPPLPSRIGGFTG